MKKDWVLLILIACLYSDYTISSPNPHKINLTRLTSYFIYLFLSDAVMFQSFTESKIRIFNRE